MSADFGKRVAAGHDHRFPQILGKEFRLGAHSFRPAADGSTNEFPACHHKVRPQGEHLKGIETGTDASICGDDYLSLQKGNEPGQHVGNPQHAIEGAAAVVGNGDHFAAGLQGSWRIFYTRDSLKDEGERRGLHELFSSLKDLRNTGCPFRAMATEPAPSRSTPTAIAPAACAS